MKKTKMTRRTMKTRRMMVMGKMKVKMKVKDEDENDFVYPRVDLVVTVQNAPHCN